MGQPHSLAASCPTGGGLATALQLAGQNRTFLLGVDTISPPVEAAAGAGPIEPPSCPSWGLIRRCEVNFADTPPSFRLKYTDFAFAKCGATRPAQALLHG